MKSREYFILIFTFLVGIFSGAYLYVTSFAPSYAEDPIAEVSEIDFRVKGQKFGGCNMLGSCPSFELKDNRSYEYTPGTATSQTPPATVGKLDRDVYEDLQKRALASDFTQLQKEGGKCAAASDGIDYEYELILDGESYQLTTCNTLFGDSLLADDLQELWTTIEVSDKVSGSGSVSDFLREGLDERFEYDTEE